MRFAEIYRYLMFALALGTFFASFRYVNSDKLRPLTGILVALAVGSLGVAINGVGNVLGIKPWINLADVLLLDEATIWHGTTFISVAYGLLGYSLFRLMASIGRRVPDDETPAGEESEQK